MTGIKTFIKIKAINSINIFLMAFSLFAKIILILRTKDTYMRICIRCITIFLLVAFAIPASSSQDSLLWYGIRDAGRVRQAGHSDSAYHMALRLTDIAIAAHDHLACATLYNLQAICLSDKGKKNTAIKKWAECAKIADEHDFLQRAVRTNSHFLFQTMLPTYAQLAIAYKDMGKSQKSLQYAMTGMKWMAKCNDALARATSMSSFSEVLMDSKQYKIIYEPMKQGVKDALQLGYTDFALMMTSYLIKIEHETMHRKMKDIPWVEVGRQILPNAKTEQAKTAYLAATTLDTVAASPVQDFPALAKADPSHRIASSKEKHHAAPKAEHLKKVTSKEVKYVVYPVFIIIALFLLYILLQHFRKKRKDLQAEKDKAKSYIDGQENERSRLARELHDGVSNQLLAIQLKLNKEGVTSHTMQMLTESREQVRRVSHELIPPEFDQTNLDDAIANYVSELDGIQHCEMSYLSSPQDADWAAIPVQTALEIYRITQEAISNSLKHSGATIIAVGLHLKEENTLVVIISDNGSRSIESGGLLPEDAKKADGHGIGKRTMEERAASIDGKIETCHHRLGNVLKLTVKLNNV